MAVKSRILVNTPGVKIEGNSAFLYADQTTEPEAAELMLHIPLEISVTTSDYEAIKIAAIPYSDAEDVPIACRAFRGAFISRVQDVPFDVDATQFLRTKTYDSCHSPHQTNACVNIRRWEESPTPFIEFRPTYSSSDDPLSGKTSLDLLAVFAHPPNWSRSPFNFNQTKIKLTMFGISNGGEDEIDSMFIDLCDERAKDVRIEDSDLIKLYHDSNPKVQQTVYNETGDGYSIHPKQLVTV
ncbi:MAG: hypothetical protein QGF94_05270, partial [Candidatus Thalassarchaeaceae archaeon]|nr:hypothetical protein [Candidatus Thalassarchaeaceae archaeon]